MPSIIDSLTLGDATRKQALAPHLLLRQRLEQAINIQIAGATAAMNGQSYSKTVERWIEDPATGERTKSQVPGRFRPWWWVGPTGGVSLEIRYANRGLELKPGKRVIDIGATDQIIPTLEKIKAALAAGELDKALNNALSIRRKELKGNKQKQA